jgi:hypothetical protein
MVVEVQDQATGGDLLDAHRRRVREHDPALRELIERRLRSAPELAKCCWTIAIEHRRFRRLRRACRAVPSASSFSLLQRRFGAILIAPRHG